MRTRAASRFVFLLPLFPLGFGCGLTLSGTAPDAFSAPTPPDPVSPVSIGGDGPGEPASGNSDAGDSALDTSPTPDSGLSADAPADSGEPDTSIEASSDAHSDAAADSASTGYPSSFPTVIGAWSFNEAAGTQSGDLSGHGHPMFFVGGATWAAGKEGSALVLDGVTGYADIGSTLIDTTKSFSVVAWVQLAIIDTWQIAVSESDVHGSLFALKLRGDGSHTFDFDVETSDNLNPGFVVAASARTAQPQVWVQLAGVYDTSGAGAVKAYVNGVLESTVVVGQPLAAATGHFVLGRGLYNDVAAAYLKGAIDEVQVFDGALTDAQVATVFAMQE